MKSKIRVNMNVAKRHERHPRPQAGEGRGEGTDMATGDNHDPGALIAMSVRDNGQNRSITLDLPILAASKPCQPGNMTDSECKGTQGP